MIVFSPLSLYTTFLAWKQYGFIYEALFQTGLVYLGFALIGFRYVKNLLLPSSPHAHVAAHARNTFMYETILAFLIFVLFVVPVVPYQASEFEFKNQCESRSVESMTQGNTNTTYDDVFSDVMTDAVKVPLMLHLIQQFTSSFSYALMKQTGCQENFNDIKNEIISTSLSTPLRKELNTFNQQCFLEAKFKFNMEKPEFKNYESLYKKYGGDQDLQWMGSKILEDLYYNDINSRKPVEGFKFSKFSTQSQKEAYGEGNKPKWGYPTCKEWWNNRLITNINSEVKKGSGLYRLDITSRISELRGKRSVSGLHGLSDKESIAKILLTHLPSDVLGAEALNINGNAAQGLMAGLTISASNKLRSFTSTPLKREAMKQTLPIMQCGIYLFIVTLMPFFIVLSGYSMKSVKTFSSLLFLVILMNYFWYLIGYFERSLEDALGESASMDAIKNGMLMLYFMVAGLVFKFSSILGSEGGSVGSDLNSSSSTESKSTSEIASSAPIVGRFIK